MPTSLDPQTRDRSRADARLAPTGELAVADLSRSFGETKAVDDVSLVLGGGGMLALLGPSGCGKTTLLRLVAGLERADRGTITIDGDVLTDGRQQVPPERRRVGMVFHDWALFPHLSVERNVAYGLSRAQVRSGRVAQTLQMVHLEHLAHRRPDELSAGQAQRVALARALAPRPRILLFDEPFSALDAELRVAVRRDVACLMRELAMTAIFVTHDQEEAFVLGDQIAVMESGRVVQRAAPAEIYHRPATAWVAGFVGDANLLRAQCHGGRADTLVGTLRLTGTQTGEFDVLARPEHLSLRSGTMATVTDVDFFGHDTTYRIRWNDSGGSARSRTSVSGFDAAARRDELLVRAMSFPVFEVGDQVAVSYDGPATVHYPV